MYNEELKNEYLSISKYKNTAKTFFSRTEKIEEAACADIATLTEKEVFDSLKEVTIGTINTVLMLKSMISEYIDWCFTRMDGVNLGIKDIKIDISSFAKVSMVSSPGHLDSVLDYMFGTYDNKTADLMSRCYLWCAFYGVPVSDANYIMEMKLDDLDRINRSIVVNNNTYEIGRIANNEFSLLSDLDYFNYSHSFYETSRIRTDSNYIFRGTGVSKSGHVSITTIKSNITRTAAESNIKISYRTVFNSGLFYRTHLLEMKGIEPDFTDYCVSFYSDEKDFEIIEKHSTAYKNIVRKRNILKKDYKYWKEAFCL